MIVGYNSLFEKITTLYKTGDYRFRKIVAKMEDSFEPKKLNMVRLIPRRANYADTLAKNSLPLSQEPITMLSFGTWTIDITKSCSLDP